MKHSGSARIMVHVGILALVAAVTAAAVLFLTGTVTPKKLIGLVTPKLVSPISQDQPAEPTETPTSGASPSPALDAGEDFAAVYLANGKMYFGQTENPDADPMVLRRVYMLRFVPVTPAPVSDQGNGDETTAGSAPQTDFELVRLADQFPNPMDQLDIPRRQILFWEPLQADSRVVKAIHEAAQAKKTQ